MKKVWSEWMGKGGLEVRGVGDGCGHFIVEEKPEETAEILVEFYNRLVAA